MGSCVSKKAARAGGGRGKVAAPLPAAEKETAHRALPPVAEVDVEEEEVKEVVLSETPAPRPPRLPPPPEPVKPPTAEQPVPEEESASVASEACSASDTAKETAKAKLLVKAGAEREAEKRAAVAPDAPSKKGRAAPADQERESSKPRVAGGGGNGRARSPSPSSAHRRQHQHPPAPAPAAQRPRREQPPVVSGIGCRSGRFSPSAARRAAESAVRRTHSAREADMALPSSSKRSLGAAINGGSGALCRRDAGERSGRRSDSPTGSRRAPASPSAAHRPASPMRKAAAGKEHVHGTPERACKPPTRARDGDEEEPLAGLLGGGERKKVEEGALGQNPSVAMECFIFL